MKKGFFWLFYLLFLIFFDIVLAVIRFNNSIYEFFINLNIKNEWILERLFLLMEIVFIIICLTFSYLISKIKVSKKSLLIPPLVIVTIKVIIFFCIFGFFMSIPKTEDAGAGGFVLYLIFFGFGAYMGMLNLYFYLGLLFNLFRRRKNEKNNS
ncbi:hypothetical protein JCM16775_1019 [Leptotrichia hofstadii]|uniref:Uncharacterized protein n=1 Tax=Leptotrichia hofstadii TaxID=157688 RepID=A0A510JIX4_9FUSO|nr:hypothetical protein [Leptotrichia hofstadii]BBM38311.1 hypothetical protein JCM16775_1019 [Leptotrichia hofstadii]